MPGEREYVVDEVQTAEALITFYEKRLAEARDRLATAQKKASHRGVG